MKKLFVLIGTLALVVSCNKSDDELIFSDQVTEQLVLTGYSSAETRTHFGTPSDNQIPYFWSAGDYIWLGGIKSAPISEDCRQAKFVWSNPPSTIGDLHIFYNMTGSDKTAKVLAEQSADGNLSNDGDFGYAIADEFGVFCLDHKTSYIWFDTKSNEQLPKLTTITVTAAKGLALAGERIYDYKNNTWANTTTNGSNQIVLNFANGVELQAENEGVFASIVTLPAAIGGTELEVVYAFADGSTFTEIKNPTKDLVAGDTQRIRTTIALSDLAKPEPELPYELRVLTFEDEDAKFEPYYLDYADDWTGREITTWSELVDDPQYGGPLTYGDMMSAMYTWYDQYNTDLSHTFPEVWGTYCYWSGGHAISNYWGEGYSNEDRNNHIAKYYGEDYVENNAGNDSMLGWFNLQLMTPVPAYSGDNFAVHFGYTDFFSMSGDVLPEIFFADGEARVIDHMYVTNTNYTLNQLMCGVGSEAGNTFGGDYTGPTEDSFYKIIAYGFASWNDEEPTSELEFYLLDGTTPVLDWEKWDLAELGAVVRVKFNLVGSEDMSGSYGLTIPAYFAYDDIAVRFEK